MKIRPRITLWIAGITLLAGALFSGYVVYELVDEPYRLIDRELRRMSDTLVQLAEITPEHLPEKISEASLPFPAEQYWIRLSGPDGHVLYRSPMTAYFTIDTHGRPGVDNLEKTIPRRLVELGQDSGEEVLFRVLTLKNDTGPWKTLVIGKPIEDLERSIQDLLLEMGTALAGFVLLVVAASYFLAGRILKPIVRINRTARQIGETSLDRRIPLDANHDELYDLTLSLNRMFDRLQYSFARQKEFIGNAAHELKSPITLLLLSHEELLQTPGIDERVHSELQRQADTLRRMSRLVKNLLDLSRLEQQGRSPRQQIDLHYLLTSVIHEYEPLLQSNAIRLTNTLPPGLVVPGDQEQLQRLLVNLLDNAWRYNLARNGEIRISGGKRDGKVVVEVANTGPGVPEEENELVFEQFFRVEKSRSLSGGGSGLGLTIARTIVQRHGGEISLASHPDGWTRVKVILPENGAD